MTADATLSIGLIVLVLGILINIYGFFNNRKKDIKGDAKEIYDIRESLVKIDMKTGQINTTMNEIRSDVRAISSKINDLEKDLEKLRGRVTAIEKEIEGGAKHE